MMLKVNKYWFGYFLIKLFYMFFAIFIYSKLTTLGDTGRWMSGRLFIPENLSFLYTSTEFMDFFGGISSYMLGSILGNLPFMILSFYGIYYSVSKLSLTNNQFYILLFLLSLPSFGIWSSVAGKEAIGVFFMGIILGYIIDILDNNRFNVKVVELISFCLMFIFKPQYSIAIFSIIIFIYLSRKLNLQGYGKLFLLIFHIILAVIVLYIYKDTINEISYILPKYFSLDAGSTRENNIWINDYDVFFNAPYGMFIAFWGVTLNEVFNKLILSIFFTESLIIFSFFLYFIVLSLKKIYDSGRVNILILSIISMMLFWLLFAQYPFGVFNPGSALRYRENFYGFLVIMLFYIYLKYIKNKNYELKR